MSSENLVMSAKRFASRSDEEILRRHFEETRIIPVNTKKGNNNAAALLRQYLREKQEDTRFESFDSYRLAEVLSHFYVDVRMQTGELYKVKTLESVRYGLNRYLKSPPHLKKFDIIRDAEFIDANESFRTMALEATAEGKGEVEHKKEIHSLDLQTLFSSIHMDCKTPSGLANKVQFDIRFYFFRKGLQKMDSMTKDTFEVTVDPSTGVRYIRQRVGELTNHSDVEEPCGTCMPEIPNSELCPVSSYLKYMAKLNPDSNRLWQYPKECCTAQDNVWYTKKPVGRNTLSKFMSTLSATCSLSTVYTNQCIRVTGASILTRRNYSPQTISLTAHKSIQSLAVSQHTSGEQKFAVGSTLNSAVTEKPVPVWPPTPVNFALLVTPVNPALQPTPVNPAMQPTPVNPAMQPTPIYPALQPTPVNPAMQPTPVNPAMLLTPVNPIRPLTPVNPVLQPTPVNPALQPTLNPALLPTPVNPNRPPTPVNPAWPPTPTNPDRSPTPMNPDRSPTPVNPDRPSTPMNPDRPPTPVNPAWPPTLVNPAWPPTPVNLAVLPSSSSPSVLPSTDLPCRTSGAMADELGKIVRPQSPTRTCSINPGDKSHIGLILSESRVTEKSCERLLSVRANEIVCALSSKTIYLSNSGQVISNIDLPYYWCNFCTFKTEEKHLLLNHLMEHRFSCQYCVFQTFSRVDVVRHTVQEHSEFDGSDLKVCVLLPDLLKHGLNQSNDTSKKSPKDTSKSNSELESELETKPPDSKRKRTESEDEDEVKKNKGEGPMKKGRRKSKRGKQPKCVSPPQSKPESEKNVQTASEEENKVTARVTRSTPKPVKKDRMPGVCFECSLCKFRTFKKAILGKHTELEHDIARPRFALKIVSLSQAQEIDASDEKNKAILNDTVPSSSKMSRQTEKKKGNSTPLPEPEPSKKNTDEEEEEVNDAVVEMDYAEEDDEDEDEDNEEDDETYEPYAKVVIKKPNPVPSDPTETVVVARPSYTCLLCSAIHDSTFSFVKNHYLDGHPGGTLVMGEVNAGSSVVQWVYFCVGNFCNFRTTNPVSWITHSRICQREAYETPDLSNSQHASVKNTVNAVKENMMLTSQQAQPDDAGKSLNVSVPQGYGSPVCIKTEPESADTIYIYESSPTKENEMFQDKQQPIQSTIPGSTSIDSVSSSSSSVQAVSTSVPVAVIPMKDHESQNASNNTIKKKMDSQVASSAVSSTSTDKSNSNTRSSASNSSSPSAVQTSNTSPVRNNSISLPSNSRNNRSSASNSSSPSANQTSNTSAVQNNSISVPSNSRNNRSPASNNSSPSAVQTSNTSAVQNNSISVPSNSRNNRAPASNTSSPSAVQTSNTSAVQNNSISVPSNSRNNRSPASNNSSPSAVQTSNTSAVQNNSISVPSNSRNNRPSASNSSSPTAVQTRNTSADRNNSISVSSNRNNSSPKTLHEREQTTCTRSPKPSNLPSGKTSSSNEKSPKTSGDSEGQFDVDKKGNYKCAHCRFLATKALEVRVHMLERHKMNPLYGLDMLAEECKVARFMLFCPKDQCTFCSKDKDFFLKHLDTCASVGTHTDEYRKRLEITRNFASSTLKKLQMLTQ